MQCVSLVEPCRTSRPFPPERAVRMHEIILQELRAEQVSSSRGRSVPRGVKRKMGRYHLRPRAPLSIQRLDYGVKLL
jgi:hypothetical protein